MASKKDKFRKAIRDRLERVTGQATSGEGTEGGTSATGDESPKPDQGEQRTEPSSQSMTVSEESAIPSSASAQAPESEGPVEKKVSEQKGAGEDVSVEIPQVNVTKTPYSRKRPMTGKRDTIYNVSSDIRLEDYTEPPSSGRTNLGKIIVGFVLLLLLLWGVKSLIVYLTAPDYVLAVAATQITDANQSGFAATQTISPPPGGAVHIRFQWEEGQLDTDRLKITAEKKINGSYLEIAAKSTRIPVTANYIYFLNILEPGSYRIRVSDALGKILKEKVFRVL